MIQSITEVSCLIHGHQMLQSTEIETTECYEMIYKTDIVTYISKYFNTLR